MCPQALTAKLQVDSRCESMLLDQRLQRVDTLRAAIRERLVRLRATERGSPDWDRILVQLEPLWNDLFCLLEELEVS